MLNITNADTYSLVCSTLASISNGLLTKSSNQIFLLDKFTLKFSDTQTSEKVSLYSEVDLTSDYLIAHLSDTQTALALPYQILQSLYLSVLCKTLVKNLLAVLLLKKASILEIFTRSTPMPNILRMISLYLFYQIAYFSLQQSIQQLMRPLLRIRSTDYFLPTFTHLSSQQLEQLKSTLIPGLQLAGLQSSTLRKQEIMDACRQLKIKNAIVGSQGVYECDKKNVKLDFIGEENLVLVEMDVVVNVEYNSSALDLKQVEECIKALRSKIYLCKKNGGLIKTDEIGNIKDIELVVPLISCSQQSNSRYSGAIPVVFYLHKNQISKEKIIESGIADLVHSLKIILKNNLPYRVISKQSFIATQDFKKEKQNKKVQKQQSRKVEQSKEVTTKKKHNVKLVVILASLLVFYLALKTVI